MITRTHIAALPLVSVVLALTLNDPWPLLVGVVAIAIMAVWPKKGKRR
jgi:4-hydroxybenzoate polyprenyltransferase